jgi:hypothetical protein
MSSEARSAAGSSAVANHPVTVIVNKQPVTVDGPRLTGLDVKKAAMAAGLKVELSFTLSKKEANSRFKNVADDDVVTVNKESVFMLTDDDDDS